MKVSSRTTSLTAGRRSSGSASAAARRLLGCLLLLPLLLLPRLTAAQDRPVLTVVVTSEAAKPDRIAVSYAGEVTPEELKQDFDNLARELGAAPPGKLKVTRGEVFKGQETITTAEAKLPGLVNWSAGAVNLDPIIQTYRRFGNFQVVWFFMGNFPMPPSGSVTHPGYRVETVANGFVTRQHIWIDQSHGVPARLEPVASAARPTWVTLAAAGAILLVLLVSGYLIIHVGRGQKQAVARGEKL